MTRAWLVSLGLALAACTPPPARPEVAIGPTLQVDKLDSSIAVVDIGDTTYAFARDALAIVRGGVVAARVAPPTSLGWTGGAAIAAPDGNGRWLVAADSLGGLWRVTGAGELEDARDRLGLADLRVRAIAAAGDTFAVLGQDAIAASTDGRHTQVFAAPGAHLLAVARHRVAYATTKHVIELDLAAHTSRDLPIDGPFALAYADADTAAPRLAIIFNGQLWRADARGALRRIANLPTQLDGVAAAGSRLWIAAARALYTVGATDDTATRATHAPDLAGMSIHRALFAAPDGAVWITPPLVRYAIDSHADAAETSWRARVQPIFQRTCAHCHLPGGDAGFDLSTAASWRADRTELVHRVVDTRTMPPAGTELTEADRAALAGWLAAP